MSVLGLFHILRQDTAYALRLMKKQPVFVVAAALTLALGIGANTAIFTLIHAVLLRPLDYQQPDHLVRISGGATVARFEEVQRARSLIQVGAFNSFSESVTLSDTGGSQGLKGVRISANFLSILGVSPQAGRSFLAEEENPGHAVAMISAGLWTRHYARDRGIIGKPVRLGGQSCTIVGVLPDGFQFPVSGVDVWMPWQPAAVPMQARIYSPMLTIFARLKSSARIDEASAEIALINRQYALAHPAALDAKKDRPESVLLFQDQLVRDVRSILWMLFGSVGLVLAIACANVGGLLMARAKSRSREFAIRAALGASPERIAAQLLTEGFLLALGGVLLGILFAGMALRGMRRMPGLELPRSGDIHLDWTVLGFTFALCALTGVIFGLLPSLSALRTDLSSVIKSGGGRAIGLLSRHFAIPLNSREFIVVCQVALSTVLLIGAALLIQSLAHLRDVDPGFQANNLLTMELTLPPALPETPTRSFEALVERVEAIPGIRSAAVTLTLPMTGYAGTPVAVMGRPGSQLNRRPIAVLQAVTPGYFRTMGIALLRGRDFARQDSSTSPRVVIINEAMARRFWPQYPIGDDPVGQSILAGASPDPQQIVGIVADVRQAGLADGADIGIYRPRAQAPPMSAMFAVRTNGDPMLFANAIRAEVTAVDRDVSVIEVKPMTEVVEASEGRRQGVTILLTAFASMGLLLTGIGVYGLIAFSVAQRTREIGVRKALGAQQTDVLRLVLRQSASLTITGSLLGLGGAFALTRVLRSLLFNVSATDPSTFVGVALFAVVVAMAASYIPARRALKIEAMAALRDDTN